MMTRLNTLRTRFAIATAGLILIILALFGLFVYTNMARSLNAELDASLALNASQLAISLDDQGPLALPPSPVDEPENVNLLTRGFLLRILTPDGKLLQEFGSSRAIPLPETLPDHAFYATLTLPGSDAPFRVYTTPVLEQITLIGYVQVAQTTAEIQTTLGKLFTTLLISIPTLVLVTGAGSYFLAARALAPVDRITRTARHISADDLAARLPVPPANDEIGRLTATLNDMLARLDAAFQRERQFTADASHELRTPLTAMQAILGMIREKRRTQAEYEQALDDLAEETDRLRTLTEKLLRLARGRPHPSTPEPVDLSTLLQDVAASLTPLAETKTLPIHCTVPEGLMLLGDYDDLIRLFVNLIDNAILYTEHGAITVTAQRDQDQIEVVVSDTGIGIPAEHLPRIFDRFYRVDKARTTRGAGLGLALVADIVRTHGGKIEVSSEVWKGTQFTVRLPAFQA